MDELFQLYVLEGFLARLAKSGRTDRFVLKGGVLLAAFDERRPTRDVDLQAQALDNDVDVVRSAVCEIASVDLDDGIVFDVQSANAVLIRDEEVYQGVRVTIDVRLATARPHFHVDVNVGDPIVPAPVTVRVSRLLGGVLTVRAYPLVMVHAEKVVTAIARGTVSTQWRDFADMYLLTRRHAVDGEELTDSIRAVALHRQIQLVPLASVLNGYGDIGQQRWAIWRRRQRLDDRLPESFGEVVGAVIDFADPATTGDASSRSAATRLSISTDVVTRWTAS